MQKTNSAQIMPLAPKQNPASSPVVSCTYGGGRFEVSDRGVYFYGKDKEGNEQSPQRICSPLYVVAKTRDDKSGQWGRWLEWQDDDGKKRWFPEGEEPKEK